jgi:hypothetical protein
MVAVSVSKVYATHAVNTPVRLPKAVACYAAVQIINEINNSVALVRERTIPT